MLICVLLILCICCCFLDLCIWRFTDDVYTSFFLTGVFFFFFRKSKMECQSWERVVLTLRVWGCGVGRLVQDEDCRI